FCALAPDHRLFILARIFAGAFGGPLGAIVFSIIGDKIPEKRRGAATGKVMSAFAMASILGIPFGLKLANAWSWRAPFFLLTGLSIILFLIGARTLPTMIDHIRKMHRRNHIRETLSILIKPNHVRAYVLSGMLLIGSFSVIPFISPYMVSNAGFLESNLMYIYLIGGSVTFFTAPLIGKLSDIFGKYRMFSIMAIISVAPILMVTHLNETADWIVIVSTTFFMICSSGRMVPATALVTSSALPHERGGFMSINSSVQQFAAGIATYFAGHIIQKTSSGKMLNYDWVGYIAIITTLLCLWLARRVRPAAGIRNLVDAKDIAGVSSEI
ncbi:MAG: sugar transporter, partial [Bacteriovoracaceae bacterium]|nr:sugar transporter [Bacteriovoracaceae bacterium]